MPSATEVQGVLVIVAPLSTASSFGGAWSSNFRAWATLLLPGTLVVAVQETALIHVDASRFVALVLLSSAAQSLASGLVTATIAAVARRRWPIIPVPLMLTMWLAIGVVRGAVGGGVAEAVTGGNPLFAQRIVIWSIVSLIWLPLVVYSAAQIEHRRRLLAELDSLRRQSEREQSHLRLSSAELQNSISVLVRDRIRPVVDEIRRSLRAVGRLSNVAALRTISDRLGEVWLDAVMLLDANTSLRHGPGDGVFPIPQKASLPDALAIDIRRPARIALLSGVAIVPAVIPLALTANDLDSARDTLVALAVTVTVLFLGAILRGRIGSTTHPRDLAAAILSSLAAGVSGSITIEVLEVTGLGRLESAIFWLLPAATVISASCVTVAVGIGIANKELVDATLREKKRVASALRRSARLDAEIREQLALLMHGPVQGRLAACVMALNFHLNSDVSLDPSRTQAVVAAVIDHLGAASRDLDDLPALTFPEPRTT